MFQTCQLTTSTQSILPEFSTCPKSTLFTFSGLTFPFNSEIANKGNYLFLLSLPMDIVSSDH